jgi:hypothetical protein
MGYHHNDLFNAMQGHVGFGEALPGRNDAAMGGALKGYEYENGARQWFPQGPEQDALQQQLNERMGTDPTLTHDPYADLDDEDWGDDDMEHFGSVTKTAGKKFTPMEQREFIDEPGVARNANKLDLKGTHYEDEQSGLSIDDFLW